MQAKITSKAGTVVGQGLLLGVVILATLGAAAGVNAQPKDLSRVAAIFPPWWPQARTLVAAASAGQILGVGGAPFVVILHGGAGQISARARSAGALFVISADPSGYCAFRARDETS